MHDAGFTVARHGRTPIEPAAIERSMGLEL